VDSIETDKAQCLACLEPLNLEKVVRRSGVFRAVSFYECSTCGTVGAFPVPSTTELASFYSSFYITASKRTLWDRAIQIFRGLSERQRALSLVGAYNKSRGKVRKEFTAVDCGAGAGALTRVLREKFGSEIRIVSVDAAVEVENLRPWATETWHLSENALLEKLALSNRKNFDVVFFSHTLEHFSNPSKVLEAFLNCLDPGGRIVIDFPHGAHPVYRDAHDLHIPDLFFFTRRGMERLAERLGATVSTGQGISPGPDWLVSRLGSPYQYLASALFILRGWIFGEGFFSAKIPVWYRVVLTK